MTVSELWQALTDPGSWRCWDEPVTTLPADPAYRAAIERARERTGLDESVVTGEGRIAGRRVALVACEFDFLAGSIGVDAGERLTRAVERATRERLPLFASPASGGTRMQEGTTAFVQMVKVTAAVTDHKAAGLPYLVYLRHPTTGGVLASWGSLGHVTGAEPGALIGFLGPRVHQALYGQDFPSGVQTAENLFAHGLLDAVLPAGRLAAVAARALRVLSGEDGPVPPPAAAYGAGDTGAGDTGAVAKGDAAKGDAGAGAGGEAGAGAGAVGGAGEVGAGASGALRGVRSRGDVPGAGAVGGDDRSDGSYDDATAPSAGSARGPLPGAGESLPDGGDSLPDGGESLPGADECQPCGGESVPGAGESLRRSRRPERPGVRALLRVAATDVTPLSGTGAGEQDPGLLLALARVGGTPCVVMGHDRPEPGRAPQAGPPPALGPAGLREARRGMRLAAELGLPLLTVVDTAGAALSVEAEQGGLAAEIARSLADLVTLPAPTLCLLLGQGAGGGALALLPADRVLAARHAWLSPLPPEGASAILHRTTDRADEVADRQGVRSADLLAHGIVDRVVEEGARASGRWGDAADDPVPFLRRLGGALGAELAALRAMAPGDRLAARRARHRRL